MSVLLTNMELPAEGCSYCIEIFSDGVWAAIEESCYHGKAIDVKAPHGALKDTDALATSILSEAIKHTITGNMNRMTVGAGDFVKKILSAPIIVPAEGGDDNE